MMNPAFLAALLLTGFIAQTPSAPPAPSQTPAIEGVRNYTRVDVTIGCAGATEVRALPSIAKQGFKAVLNLRETTEAGASIEESRAASQAAGLKYIHLPFNGSAPTTKLADEFVWVVNDPANQPLFIHCGSGNRLAALWLIRRMITDKWTEERAVAEARTIGLASEALLKFALEYVAARKD
jgi:uncharacterized protein (TIGR01244 family)